MIHRAKRARLAVPASAALTIGALAAAPAHAELVSVDQAVFGMDCAPCAFSMERGLERLAGVEDVTVSLDEARAVVTLAPGNTMTLREIRGVVRNGGFDPRQAHVEDVELAAGE